MADRFDLLVLGSRVRHARRRAGVTLAEVSDIVNRPAPYLSQLETGKVEPKLTLLGELAEALGTTTADFLAPEPPNRRASLEVSLARAQSDPAYRALGLPHLKPSAKVSNDVLEHLVALWNELGSQTSETRQEPPSETRFADVARSANIALRAEMRERANHYPEIEAIAAQALADASYPGTGPISERVLTELVANQGFTIERVRAMPPTARSITDIRDKIIFIPDRGGLKIREARSVVLQTLGHFALAHHETSDFAEYLRQRIESNYFAAAILAPEAPAVDFLREAQTDDDISVEDLKEIFYISYEMAAHRFTNLATRHLGIPCHFLRTDREGVINKAYENDGIRFPAAPDGGLEGQRVPRQWGSRQAWNATGSFLLHSQFTVTNGGEYFCTTYIETETDRWPHAITLGTPTEHARHFRGSDTLRKEYARDREIEPDPALVNEWKDITWPSAAERSHVLSALPPSDLEFSPFPGIDLLDVYRFLERQRRGRRL
ncbi:MAG: helix-turn-helix domain-containing protein [Acidimicrobiaceae bacterium]|nr:helix-turn-helix domain-containing protein [Acidimicrobiaceae bacterium]